MGVQYAGRIPIMGKLDGSLLQLKKIYEGLWDGYSVDVAVF